ncbi:hypothetical protein JANAI62_29890 [Jannaschia pagri]|uniref:Oxidoreductase n=1 Tax=Jannaschia pagri TaxID=2829797 RepID=A0ABQ4NPM6_9RHOB|nr:MULTISPECIES: DUF934 domain-containing protein [unclassified Jannaschia]GIT92531.1 hypothetical protein JANAI61_29890 [Jannaschia sp. AI_61]GIT96366.1 hypothetical protein JANAI62_29890 [Jannaschia sp. AI_62]
MPIVTDTGFGPDDLNHGFAPSDDLPANGPLAIDVASDADLTPVLARLDETSAIRVAFPSFADGRGFTIARQLRQAGYTGRLRAQGHVIADQYAMARRAGFDEVEIDDALAARQPEDQWRARADWKAHDYQSRLGRRRAG